MIEITFQAVSKVIVAVLVGAFCCGSIPNSKTTMRDFSFLISNVLLPALTVTNTASAVDLKMLIRCSVLLLFGVIVIFIGIGSAIIMAHMLFGVRKTKTGIPAELYHDIRLDLHFDEVTEERHDATGSHSPEEKKKKHKKKQLGTPYVAIVLSKKMRELGVDGHEVVAGIEVPAVEVEEFPFYYWGAWVACSIQNTVTLPLSLLQNLCESVEWLSFSEGTAYIFVFSITASLYIWACGPFYVESAQKETTKRRLIREIVTRHKKMMTRSDAITQTDISYTASHDVLNGGVLRDNAALSSLLPDTQHHHPHHRHDHGDAGSPVGRKPNALGAGADGGEDPGLPLPLEASVPMGAGQGTTSRSTSPPPEFAEAGEQTEFQAWSPNTARRFSFPELGCAQQIPYNWETAGYLRVKFEDQLKETKGPSTLSKVASAAKQVGSRLVRNIPFMSIVVGMFIGIIPPLRALFFNGGALEMITDAVILVGQGNIPAALLLLGANLVGSTSTTAAGPQDVRMRDFEQNTDFPLIPANDSELLGAEGKYAEWYNLNHEQIEFDEHASFSLHTILQQQAAERIAAARSAAAAAAANAQEEAGEDNGSGDSAAKRRLAALVATPTQKTTDELIAEAAAKQSGGASGIVLDDDDEAVKKDDGCMSGVKRALSLDGVKKRFVWGVIADRLLITPALGFLMLIAMIHAAPFLFGGKNNMDKTLLVVLFMELAAPTAINSALLFNQREYMTYPWAKMLFFQYILCTVTLVFWATIGLEYVARYVD